MNYARMTTSKK